jgi:hypothetical protein
VISILVPEGAAPMSTDATRTAMNSVRLEQTLDVSKSRAYNCALDILRAYKLSGNFPINLQIVLQDLGALPYIAFVIEPKRCCSDRRRVLFRPRDNVDADTFSVMIQSVKDRIAFEAQEARWISWGRTLIAQRTFTLFYAIAIRLFWTLMGREHTKCIEKLSTL